MSRPKTDVIQETVFALAEYLNPDVEAHQKAIHYLREAFVKEMKEGRFEVIDTEDKGVVLVGLKCKGEPAVRTVSVRIEAEPNPIRIFTGSDTGWLVAATAFLSCEGSETILYFRYNRLLSSFVSESHDLEGTGKITHTSAIECLVSEFSRFATRASFTVEHAKSVLLSLQGSENVEAIRAAQDNYVAAVVEEGRETRLLSAKAPHKIHEAELVEARARLIGT